MRSSKLIALQRRGLTAVELPQKRIHILGRFRETPLRLTGPRVGEAATTSAFNVLPQELRIHGGVVGRAFSFEFP